MTQPLTIGWAYLTGHARATDPSDREVAEWPPHPGRVWLALAATHFETGADAAEGAALTWLQTLPHPQLWLPRSAGARRRVTTVYVPVNDSAEGSALLQTAPLTRSKQPRTFPTVWVGDAPCFLHWPEAPDDAAHRAALARLCAKVTRLGHSASLVQMWLADGPPSPDDDFTCWLPETEAQAALAECQLRGIRQGPSLERLRDAFQVGRRPAISLWVGYARRTESTRRSEPNRASAFDQEVIALVQTEGPVLPVTATLRVTQALRGALFRACPQQPPPAWLSGHDSNGRPLADGRGHLAIFPLPFVGHEHADGHLLGVALALPPDAPRAERAAALGWFLFDDAGQPADIRLTLGRLGVWVLRKRPWDDPRATLRPETWTAAPRGAEVWASVTPVVLDRFPKAQRVTERAAWEREVGALIFAACCRAGLPEPVEIDFDATSWHRGTPRAYVNERQPPPLPGAPAIRARRGDGFPFYFAKGSNAPKPQLHVFLRFAEPVVGPVLLGAGRFLGYGLCKPLFYPQSFNLEVSHAATRHAG